MKIFIYEKPQPENLCIISLNKNISIYAFYAIVILNESPSIQIYAFGNVCLQDIKNI